MMPSEKSNATDGRCARRALDELRWLMLLPAFVAVLWATLELETFKVAGQLVATLVAAYLAGCVVALIPNIPPLLGMMIAGAALKNLNLIDLPSTLTAHLRSMALAVILLRAGSGLDLSVLKKLSATCIRLTFLPCFVEAFAVCLVSHFLLDLPYLWGLLLGFVLAAVSPAVIVPAMIDLTARKLGTDKGIPTLLMAASSFDDVAAITGFGVVLGMIFSGGTSWAINLATGPLEAAIGLIVGAVLGVILAVAFKANRGGQDQFDVACALHLLTQGMMAILISNKLNFGGVGPLAVITTSAVAVLLWKKQAKSSDLNSIAQSRSCNSVLASLWRVFEPVLFSMIGVEIQLSKLTPSTIANGLLTLAICLTVRIVVTFAAVSCSTLNTKEKLFVCVGWLPKATVQAALAPTALDTLRSWTAAGKTVNREAFHYSETVLTTGVLAIVLTAPIGAVAISVLAPRLLKRESSANDDEFPETVFHSLKKNDDEAP